jgi:RNA polymerase sigma factor (sigma-70 family)
VLDYIRNRNTRRKYETEWTESQPTETDSARDPSDVAEARILIDQAASRLTEEERTLFWMSYWQVPHEEIARITGLSRTAVQQRIFRLRKKLGKEFSGSDGNTE